jgi:DNA-binding NtrC family response regulator
MRCVEPTARMALPGTCPYNSRDPVTIDHLEEPAWRGMRLQQILVVDDEDMIRHFAARILTAEGYHVVQAADGAAALEVLNGHAVDLVVSDVMMPRLNGIQLLEHLSVAQPGLPILLMSGYGTVELVERGMSVPCALLHKPFPPDRLLSEVRRCLESRPVERAGRSGSGN